MSTSQQLITWCTRRLAGALVVALVAVVATIWLPVATQAQQSQYLTVSSDATGNIIVSWRNTPGNNQDWVSVVPAGTADDTFESTWTFTGGQRSGTYNAGQLADGSYEARLYLDWPSGGYNVVDRLPFTVSGGRVGGGAADLTGLWQDNSGADYRIRQLGTTVYWSMDATAVGSYANVFVGTIDGATITGSWVDLPGSPDLGGGDMTLRIDSPNHLVKVRESPCCYGAQEWFRQGGG
ncbi:MAG: hypothetical protein WD178_07610 [Actinomycetota bacterium]